MLTVIPVARTSVDWETLQKVSFAALGRPIMRPLDDRMISNRGVAEAIVAYGELQQEHADYLATLRDAGAILKHFSVSFLVACDDRDLIYEVAIEGDLKILDCDSDKLAIVSASLEQWRTSIINYASHRSTRTQRDFAGLVLLAFDKMGLGQLWANYSRSGGRDLILTERR